MHKRRRRDRDARKPLQRRGFDPWSGAGSNCRPLVFQTSALPAELPDRADTDARAETRAEASGGSDGI
jgi:hypothetical protein